MGVPVALGVDQQVDVTAPSPCRIAGRDDGEWCALEDQRPDADRGQGRGHLVGPTGRRDRPVGVPLGADPDPAPVPVGQPDGVPGEDRTDPVSFDVRPEGRTQIPSPGSLGRPRCVVARQAECRPHPTEQAAPLLVGHGPWLGHRVTLGRGVGHRCGRNRHGVR